MVRFDAILADGVAMLASGFSRAICTGAKNHTVVSLKSTFSLANSYNRALAHFPSVSDELKCLWIRLSGATEALLHDPT